MVMGWGWGGGVGAGASERGGAWGERRSVQGGCGSGSPNGDLADGTPAQPTLCRQMGTVFCPVFCSTTAPAHPFCIIPAHPLAHPPPPPGRRSLRRAGLQTICCRHPQQRALFGRDCYPGQPPGLGGCRRHQQQPGQQPFRPGAQNLHPEPKPKPKCFLQPTAWQLAGTQCHAAAARGDPE